MSSHLFKRFEKLLFFAYLLLRSNVCLLICRVKKIAHPRQNEEDRHLFSSNQRFSVFVFTSVSLRIVKYRGKKGLMVDIFLLNIT